MTPQERQLIDDLFDRLAKLENAPRDPEAMSAIMQGLRKAPNAVYALVQTALVQDEALKRADSRIQELEAAIGQQEQPQNQRRLPRSRCATRFSGRASNTARAAQGSVPNVRAPEIGGSRPAWNTGQVLQQGQPAGQYGQPGYGQRLWSASRMAAAAVAVRRRWRLVPRHRRGGRRRRGRRLDAGQQHPRSMMGGGGGNQQSFGDTAGHSGGIEDRRPWERSVRRQPRARRRGQRHRFVRPARRQQRFRFAAGILRSGLARRTITTWITTPTVLTMTAMATAITPERRCDLKKKRPPDRAAVLISGRFEFGLDQITMTLAPTLTRP